MNFDRHYLLIFFLFLCWWFVWSFPLSFLSFFSLFFDLFLRLLFPWVKTASTSRAQTVQLGSALRLTEPLIGSRRSRPHTVQTSCRESSDFWTLFSASPTDLWLPPDSLPEQWWHMNGNDPSSCKSNISNTKKEIITHVGFVSRFTLHIQVEYATLLLFCYYCYYIFSFCLFLLLIHLFILDMPNSMKIKWNSNFWK